AAASILSRCDFGVVGTGDLSALLCGAGREVLGPAHQNAIRDVLRPLLARIAGAARSANRSLEAAGPAARQPIVVCALRDLGYSGVSVAPADVAAVRDILQARRA
ncbi:MAG: putative PEP-binding protein, partial [Myxococcota bacterium]|nr:putative PEP-binding protein [Myxococcota bacterium]